MVEGLRAKGAHFRSLADPIDTSGPSGVLVLQMLGAVAEFERSLIRERTKAGLRAAKARGRVGGNPGLRAGDPTVLRKLAASRRASRLAGLLPELDRWLPLVRKLRPARPWPDVADAVNAALPAGHRHFTTDRLVSAIKLLVAETLAEPALLGTAPRRRPRKGRPERTRATEVAAALVAGRSRITLAQVGIELTRLGLAPPRGGKQWAPSSVKALLDQAHAAGLPRPGLGRSAFRDSLPRTQATGCRHTGSGKARDIVDEDAVRPTTKVIVPLCPKTGFCQRSNAALRRHERDNRRIGEHCQGDRNADAVNGQKPALSAQRSAPRPTARRPSASDA